MTDLPKAGEHFGAFMIKREVGRGGMGVVFAAQQQQPNRTVALKVLDPKFTSDPSFVARFTREAEILSTLNSPHVIQVYDHGRVGDCLYLAMQPVTGGDLAQYLQEHGPIPLALAAGLTAQVASALADAHAGGIIHRDIKPSNVLLARTGTDLFAYLCDFGIAQSEHPGLTETGMFPGSLAFTAPERHEGRPADERSDLYSLGCLFWTLLTGSAPYDGTNFQIAQQHFNAPIPQLTGSGPVVTETNRLLGWLLAKDPARRPASAVDAVAALRAFQRYVEAVQADPRMAGASAAPVADPELIEDTQLRPPEQPPVMHSQYQQGPAPSPAQPTTPHHAHIQQTQHQTSQPPQVPKRGVSTAVKTVAVVVVAALVGGGGLWALTTLFSGAAEPGGSPNTALVSPSPSNTVTTEPTSDSGSETDSKAELTRGSVQPKATDIWIGGNPHGVAINPGSRLAFVANYTDDSVSVVNLDSNTVVRKIEVGDKPQNVAIDPASGLLLVGCDGIPAVQIYDLQSYQLVGSVSTGKGPIRIAVHSGQKLAYAVAQGSTKMQVINLSNRKLVRTIDVGENPRVISVDERDQIAYIGHWASRKVSVIDLNSQSKLSSLEVGLKPNSIEIATEARLAFVANYGDGDDGGGSVSVIDLNTRSVKKTIGVDDGPSRLAVDEDAGVAYVTCLYSSKVNVIGIASLSVEGRFGTAHRPTGAGVDTSTGKLYVTSFDERVLQVFAP